MSERGEAIFTVITDGIARVTRGRVSNAAVQADSRLIEDLGVDSVRLIELKNELEQRLGIDQLPIEDLFDVSLAEGRALTVAALVGLCEQVLQGDAPRICDG